MNDLSNPVTPPYVEGADFIPKEDYVSPDFARAEALRLWPRVWQVACREEEIPSVGDYVTYDVADESIIVVRTAENGIAAYHNVCQHRGRRLTEGCGRSMKFQCRFHGWAWNIDGSIARVVDRENWGSGLGDDDIRLPGVRVDTWGGWVFINMDLNAEPLLEFLAPLPEIFKSFELESLRYRWYKTTILPANWKAALEAFDEGYHVQQTHRQLLPYHEDQSISRAFGRHGMYILAPGGLSFGSRSARLSPQPVDYRRNVHEMVQMMERDLKAQIPDRTAQVSQRLLTELPPDASQLDVLVKFGEIARDAALAEGAGWPNLTPEDIGRAGVDWHMFPNVVFLPSPDGMLAYRARPNGKDPDSCIYDVWSLVRYAPGGAPPLKREFYADWREHDWGLILIQDFENMAAVQQGMKSSGFSGSRTNPVQERTVSNFHRALRAYISTE